jgi:hypothetical protein
LATAVEALEGLSGRGHPLGVTEMGLVGVLAVRARTLADYLRDHPEASEDSVLTADDGDGRVDSCLESMKRRLSLTISEGLESAGSSLPVLPWWVMETWRARRD